MLQFVKQVRNCEVAIITPLVGKTVLLEGMNDATRRKILLVLQHHCVLHQFIGV